MKVHLNFVIILLAISPCLVLSLPSRLAAEEDLQLIEIQGLIHEAESLLDARQFDTAIILGKLALEKAESKFGKQDTVVARALQLVGICYWRRSDYAECESSLNKALDICQEILGPSHPEVVATLNVLGSVYREQGKYDQAEPVLKRALEIREKALGADHPDVAISLHNLGFLCWNQGKYAEAELLYKRALDIRKKVLVCDPPEIAATLNNLGLVYWNQGRYAEAESLYLQALDFGKKVLGEDHLDVAATLNNLGLIYWNQGRHIEAESLYIQVLDIRRKALGPDHPLVANSLNNLGILFWDQGRFADADSLYRQALDIKKKALGPEHPDIATSLNNLAFLYRNQGKYAEAESLYREGLDIRKKALGPDHPYVATSLYNLGLLCSYQGKYAEAGAFIEQAFSMREELLGLEHPDAARSLQSPAILYGLLGEDDKCVRHFDKLQRSRQHFMEHVFSYASEEQKMRYIKKYPLIDYAFISFAVMTDLNEAKSVALEIVLKGKAVVIDAVSAERRTALCSYDDNLRAKAERHAEICGEISALTLAGDEQLDPKVYRERLQVLYNIKDSLEMELSKTCEEFEDELAARKFSVNEAASALPEETVLWEFVRYEPYDFKKAGKYRERDGPPRYMAFTLNHKGHITLTDLGDAEEIDSLVGLAREQIYKGGTEVYSPMIGESEKRLEELTGRLYDIIFAPLASSVGSLKDIYISPDGQLSLLPFEILPSSDGKYVIERYKISYLSSGRDLLRFKKGRISSNWALAIADPDYDLSTEFLAEHKKKTLEDSEVISFIQAPSRGISGCPDIQFSPLPYASEESKFICDILQQNAELNADLYYGRDALEEVLKGMTTPPLVLHLATHGFFCEDLDFGMNTMLENPLLRCGLAFAGANRLMNNNRAIDSQMEDGILTAFEASGLNLVGTELVTLSACETGVGEVKNGEGVYGLRRAFQIACARTILISLWKVPDKETCELMGDFYRNWLIGQSKKEALRQSALKILNECRARYGFAHPLFWGGFVMVGAAD